MVIIDHDVIRKNYAEFKKHLPKVQAYYAVKANPAPEIVRTLVQGRRQFRCGVAAGVHAGLRKYQGHLPPKAQQDFIWDKIIYANPTKPKETLLALDQYKPLVTYDNLTELEKIRKYAPHAGVVLRLAVAEHRFAMSSSRPNSAAIRAKRWI